MVIYRNFDVISKNEDLEKLYTFKDFPVFFGCTLQDKSKDIFYDLNVYISISTGVLQINPTLSLDLVYQNSHNSGVVGKIWESHHRSFSDFIHSFSPTSILEIGSGHGKLCELNKEKINWTMIDPNPIYKNNIPANIIKEYFTDEINLTNINFDTIVHSHLFEHVYDPNLFVKTLNYKLKIGEKVIFSIPNMNKMLQKKFTNTLNFEHTYLLTEDYVKYLMINNGFKLISMEYFGEFSIFYAWEKTDRIQKYILKNTLYSIHKNLYLEYIDFHLNLVNEYNKILSKYDKYYLFGGHIFSQYLIQFGLSTDNLVCILDNDIEKQGKRLYGTNFQVSSPSILKNEDIPIVIVRAGSFTEEIKMDIINNINDKTIFL